MDNIFLPKKKNYGEKKKKCGLPTGFKKGHPLDRKQKFFLGWPYTKLVLVSILFSLVAVRLAVLGEKGRGQ